MEPYNWSDYIANDINLVIDKNIKQSIRQLVSLANHSCFITEIALFRKNYRRILVRLRNCKFTSHLKKIRKLLSLYINIDIASQLSSNCQPFFKDQVFDNNKASINLPNQQTVVHLMKEMKICGKILMSICRYTSLGVIHCHLWLRLGHLLPYFIFNLANISRLNIISRALLVHTCDTYLGFYQFLDKSIKCDKNGIPSSINHFLIKLDLKPLKISEHQNQQSQSELLQELLDQDVGTPMFRESQMNFTASQFDVNNKGDIKNKDLNMTKPLSFLQNKPKQRNPSSFLTRSKVPSFSFKFLTNLKKQRKQKNLIKKCLKRMKKSNEMFLMIKDNL